MAEADPGPGGPGTIYPVVEDPGGGGPGTIYTQPSGVDSLQTRIIGGNLTRTQSFALDPGLLQYVQSVLIEVDATASAATNPVLTMKTQDGIPVAAVEQGRSITGGVAGRATWAHRLDDEGGGRDAGNTPAAEIRQGGGGVPPGNAAAGFVLSFTS